MREHPQVDAWQDVGQVHPLAVRSGASGGDRRREGCADLRRVKHDGLGHDRPIGRRDDAVQAIRRLRIGGRRHLNRAQRDPVAAMLHGDEPVRLGADGDADGRRLDDRRRPVAGDREVEIDRQPVAAARGLVEDRIGECLDSHSPVAEVIGPGRLGPGGDDLVGGIELERVGGRRAGLGYRRHGDRRGRHRRRDGSDVRGLEQEHGHGCRDERLQPVARAPARRSGHATGEGGTAAVGWSGDAPLCRQSSGRMRTPLHPRSPSHPASSAVVRLGTGPWAIGWHPARGAGIPLVAATVHPNRRRRLPPPETGEPDRQRAR